MMSWIRKGVPVASTSVFSGRTDAFCSVCYGLIECKGGAYSKCRKRDPRPSHIAGILDTYGGLRFVVAHKKTFKRHCRHDEVLIIVPDLMVHEPIAWNDIPSVIARITLTVNNWINERSPNEPHAQEAVRMYRLRCLEHTQRSFDLAVIAQT